MSEVTPVYDKIASWFAENRTQLLLEKRYLDSVIGHIGSKGKVLDAGCGTGIPIMKYLLSNGLDVTGLDASAEMLNIARQNLPDSHFVHADMRYTHLNKKFDGIIAWHSFFHLPPADQPATLNIFREHLTDGGVLLFTSGTAYGEAWGENGGEQLYHGSLDRDEYRRILEELGFEILTYVENDVECGGINVWLAKVNVKCKM